MGRLGGFVPQLSIVRVVIVSASNRNERVSASIGHGTHEKCAMDQRETLLNTHHQSRHAVLVNRSTKPSRR